MSENHHSEPVKGQTDILEDEIALIDLLRVIWKWKYLIIVGTIVCALAAAIFSLSLPKIYSVDTILEPGIMRITTDNGNQARRVYIDSPQNIKALIDNGSFENQILASLSKQSKDNDFPETIKFNTSIPAQSNVVKVSYETTNVEQGKKILNFLNDLLLKKYSDFIQYYQREFDSKIKQKEDELSKISTKILIVKNEISTVQSESDTTVKLKLNKIATIESAVEAQKIQIVNSQKWIEDIQIEIVRINKNTDFLLAERKKLLASKKEESNILSSIMYINTIQQNIAYSNNLKNEINNATNQIVRDQADIERLENEIRDLDAEKEDLKQQTKYQISTLQSQIVDMENQKKYILEEIPILEHEKDNVQNLQILKQPISSPGTIKPKKLPIVILAALIGIFTMVFLSFFLEYITKNREKRSLQL